MFTNKQLADFAIMAYEAGTPYWYGTCWYACTEDLLKTKTKQYPSHYTADRTYKYKQAIQQGKMCADCVGLIKGFFWSLNNTTTTKKANFPECPDKNANDFFNLCKEQGDIKSIPNVPGLAVWQEGHIGIYIGDGWAIEARGFAYGVQKTEVAKRTWKKWGKLPSYLLTYGEALPDVVYKLGDRTLKQGMTGDDVKELQTALILLGITCGLYGADGDFGPDTKKAVMNFQGSRGLEQDGIFGAKSFAALQAAMVPDGTPDESEPVEADLPELKKGSKDKLIKGTVAYLQTKLVAEGNKIEVDGDFGPKTEDAVKAFQKKKGLNATGIVDPKTWGWLEKGD